VVQELRADKGLAAIPLLLFARDAGAPADAALEVHVSAADAALVSFVERAA
jgi:hypothetical protein